jgi:hypothetical protein
MFLIVFLCVIGYAILIFLLVRLSNYNEQKKDEILTRLIKLQNQNIRQELDMEKYEYDAIYRDGIAG